MNLKSDQWTVPNGCNQSSLPVNFVSLNGFQCAVLCLDSITESVIRTLISDTGKGMPFPRREKETDGDGGSH